MKNSKKRFALCIENLDYQASLVKMKLYEIIPDEDAAKDDFIRIVDESGEDYLYHSSYFILLELPTEVEQALESI